jgi:PLP dependent protein
MPVHTENYQRIINELGPGVTLVAVSKTKPVEDIEEMYALGQRDFGENYVQELVDKQAVLPADIRWHFIGHLQSNKVKYIAPFVHLVHGVDSFKLLQEIDRQAAKQDRVIDCLLQVHIAQEETKFGLDEEELEATLHQYAHANMRHTRIAGLMGMASFTTDTDTIRTEFQYLHTLYVKHSPAHAAFTLLSMGMSGDYAIAIAAGSNMVRIGSLLFGERNYPK